MRAEGVTKAVFLRRSGIRKQNGPGRIRGRTAYGYAAFFFVASFFLVALTMLGLVLPGVRALAFDALDFGGANSSTACAR